MTTLSQAFESQVDSTPGALAFKNGGVALSYSEFDRAANRLAYAIVEAGCVPGERVALLAQGRLNQALAQIAVLKAGLVCVPADPALPPARLARILSDSGAGLTLIDGESRADLLSIVERFSEVLRVDKLPRGLPDSRPQGLASPSQLAYLLYTSGSTGQPKGVMQTHRNFLHVASLYRTDLGLSSEDRLTNPSSLSYAAAIWGLLAALTNGAAYVVTEADSARQLVDSLARERVTVLQAIVSFLRQIMHDLDEQANLPHLRLAYTGGETLHRADVERFTRVFGQRCRLMVDLGSTEASIITHLAADEWARDPPPGVATSLLPCGRPVRSVQVTLVDDCGNPVGAGEVGQIVVRSPFLSPGYWNRPDLEAQRLGPDPSDGSTTAFFTGDLGQWLEDGTLLHLGRLDDQVKVMAHKVHLAEVEAAIRELPGVRTAAVIAVEDTLATVRIAAYVVLDPAASVSAQDIRRRLAAHLPTYMVPARIFFLEDLPTVENGKLDRAALAARDWPAKPAPPESNFGRNPVLQALAAMWAEVLDAAPSSGADDFFESGGDSLRMMQLIARVEARWGLAVDMRTLFEHHTLQAMAHFVESRVAHAPTARRES